MTHHDDHTSLTTSDLRGLERLATAAAHGSTLAGFGSLGTTLANAGYANIQGDLIHGRPLYVITRAGLELLERVAEQQHEARQARG